MFKKKIKRIIPEGAKAAIKKSICTGEETFGYIQNGKFISLELCINRDDVFSSYGIKKEDVVEIY